MPVKQDFADVQATKDHIRALNDWPNVDAYYRETGDDAPEFAADPTKSKPLPQPEPPMTA